MMMTTLNKSTLLNRIAGDKRQVGAKIAKELESTEIIFSNEKNAKGNAVERAIEANGKTTITIYESNIGTEHKEALAAYYLCLEWAKMLISRKSEVTDKAKLETNSECLVAANEVAFGIANATKTSATEETALKAVRKAIDATISTKVKPTSGNSDAVEVLATKSGIVGLDSVEGRAKKLSKIDITPPTTSKNATEEKETNTEEKDKTPATSDADKPKIATPRSTVASDDTSTSSAKDNELINIGGQIKTRKEFKTLLKSQAPTWSDAKINEMIALMPTVSSTTASPTDMFLINGVPMNREQATAKLKEVRPTATSAEVDTYLASIKITTPTPTGASSPPASNPNEQVEFMGQKFPRSFIATMAKQLNIPESLLNSMVKPVVTTPPATTIPAPVAIPATTPTNPLLGMPNGVGAATNPLLTGGYIPNPYGVQPRSTTAPPPVYNNPSVFSPQGRTSSGLPIIKAGT